jgi:type IV pilus assembly protein PilN
MIKVNLLAITPGSAPAREWLPREQRSAAVGLVLLMATSIGVGGWWWYLRHERTTVEQSITTAEAELVRLKDVATLVDRATARKVELAERVDLIERLRATMRAPVSLLETVSRSVPHGLWLLELKQIGTTIQLDGRATSLTGVTEFAEQMANSGLFQRPVEIDSTTTEMVEDVSVIRFKLKANVVANGVPANAVVSSPPPAPVPAPAPTASPVTPSVLPTAPKIDPAQARSGG